MCLSCIYQCVQVDLALCDYEDDVIAYFNNHAETVNKLSVSTVNHKINEK